MKIATERQAQILDYIKDFTLIKGFPPTFRDIQTQFDFSSTNAVVCHLTLMKQKGLLTWDKKRSRTLRPL